MYISKSRRSRFMGVLPPGFLLLISVNSPLPRRAVYRDHRRLRNTFLAVAFRFLIQALLSELPLGELWKKLKDGDFILLEKSFDSGCYCHCCYCIVLFIVLFYLIAGSGALNENFKVDLHARLNGRVRMLKM